MTHTVESIKALALTEGLQRGVLDQNGKPIPGVIVTVSGASIFCQVIKHHASFEFRWHVTGPSGVTVVDEAWLDRMLADQWRRSDEGWQAGTAGGIVG